MGTPRLSVWVDDPRRVVLRPAFWRALRELGFSGAAVMVDTMREGWDPSWKPDDLRKLRDLAWREGLMLSLTVWPDPHRQHLGQMLEGVHELLEASGAYGLELDTEHNWTDWRVEGFSRDAKRQASALDVAAEYLVDGLLELRAERNVRLELTTFPFHRENGSKAHLAPWCDLLFPQAYSVHHRKKPDERGKYTIPWEVPWDHAYGPGRMQTFALDRAESIPRRNGTPRMGVGLAAYDQVFLGKSASAAIFAAWDAVKDRVEEVRFWSSKWLVGVRSKDAPASLKSAVRSLTQGRAA